MADDFRQRLAAALAATCKRHQIESGCISCDRRLAAVLAVRDEEMAELREQVAFQKHQADTYRADLQFLERVHKGATSAAGSVHRECTECGHVFPTEADLFRAYEDKVRQVGAAFTLTRPSDVKFCPHCLHSF